MDAAGGTADIQKEIVSADIEFKEVVQDIQKCQLDNDELNARNRQASEAYKRMCRLIEKLGELAGEYSRKEDREEFATQIETYSKLAHRNQVALRKANLIAKRCLDDKLRNDLFNSAETKTSDGVRRRGKMEKDGLIRNSANVTQNLLSISRMMSDQVQNSSTAIEHLVDSSGAIVESAEEAKSMTNIIQQSSKLLSKYDRRETTDKILIFFTFMFFFACCLYVLKKRVALPFSWLTAGFF